MSIQGASTFPWAYARFLIFVVPIIILFIAEGIDFYSRTYFSKQSFRATTIMVLFLILTWLPQTIDIFDQKISQPWHRVAAFIQEHVQKGDVILGSDSWDALHLHPYFSETDSLNPFQLQLNDDSLSHIAFRGHLTTIYFVTSIRAVNTAYPSYNFGKIQVIIYKPPPDQSSLRIMRDDLVSTVKAGKEIAPEFTTIYRNIWDINNRLGITENNFLYYNLWIKCLELTPRQKNIPSTLQRWEAQNFLKSQK